jgi:small subunit ribosomal protein S16
LAVRIRLTRVGATKRPAYRVIAIDKRRSRDGRALEILGYYDPLTDPKTVKLDTDRINAWIGKGAQPSDTVVKLMKQASQPAPAAGEKPKRATRAKPKPKASAKAAAAAETAEEAQAAASADAAPAEEALATETAEASLAEEGPAEETAAVDDTASDEKADA